MIAKQKEVLKLAFKMVRLYPQEDTVSISSTEGEMREIEQVAQAWDELRLMRPKIDLHIRFIESRLPGKGYWLYHEFLSMRTLIDKLTSHLQKEWTFDKPMEYISEYIDSLD